MKELREKLIHSSQPVLRIGGKRIPLGNAVALALVETEFLDVQRRLEEQKKKRQRISELSLNDSIDCARIAAIIAAPQWQKLHDVIDDFAIEEYQKMLEKLGGDVD